MENLQKKNTFSLKERHFEKIHFNQKKIFIGVKENEYFVKVFGLKNLKCLFGFHKWTKLGGPKNVGGGTFEQRYRCTRCYKVKTVRK